MKKIPCLFVRVFHGRDHATLTEEVTPGCEWVLAGEGSASRKWDGTACMVRDGVLYKRLDCKRGKTPPPGAIPCQDPDAVTGHWPHWVKVDYADPADRWFVEADIGISFARLEDGTYELIGPKVNGNPEHCHKHVFRRHGDVVLDVPRTYNGIYLFLASFLIEGVVFAHPDGRMCKIRRDDYGLAWPIREATEVRSLRPLTEQDGRVLAALYEVPDSDSPERIEQLASHANVTPHELIDSMHRLALRRPDPEA